ncbi:hypothetical protein Tco_0154174 [Tanacetum coccineum]
MKRIFRDRILKGDIELHFIPTEYQLTDIFTKPLDEPTSTRLKAELGIIVVAYDPFPSIDETEQHPLREFLVKFLVLNGQRPLTLDFHTFCSSNGLDYQNGKYVAHPIPYAVKKELGKIAINASYMDKTLVQKNSFPVACRILFTFMIQVLSGNHSFTHQVNLIQQLLAYSLITGTEVDIGEIIYSDILTKLLNKSRLKYVSYPRFIPSALQGLLGCDYTQDVKFGFLPGILSNSNFTKDLSKVTNIELTAHMIAVNNQKDPVSPLPFSGKKKKVNTGLPSTLDEGTRKSQPLPEGTTSAPKDLGGNVQPTNIGLPSMASNEETAKTTPLLEGPIVNKDLEGFTPPDMEPITPIDAAPLTSYEGELDAQPLVMSAYADVRTFLLSDDETQDSDEDILGAGEEVDEDPQAAAKQHQSPTPQRDKPESSIAPHTEASDSNSSCADILKKYDNTLLLTEQKLEKYL